MLHIYRYAPSDTIVVGPTAAILVLDSAPRIRKVKGHTANPEVLYRNKTPRKSRFV